MTKRFFTKIQDQVKNPDHWDFSLGKETLYPNVKTCFSLKHQCENRSLPSQKDKWTAGKKIPGLFLGTLAGCERARNP